MDVRLRVTTTTLSTRDAGALAAFYERLLGWPRGADEPGWVTLRQPDATHGLGFHEDVEYVAPTWPSRPDGQRMMVHLEIACADLDAAVRHAVGCGATEADHQPQRDVRVMLDPDGHPFCLWLWPDMPA